MNILILGSGLLGVSTAYELGKRGYQVTVLERQVESARETSYANGGQLSYSNAEPWASPRILAKLPKWLIRSDAPLVFRLRADPKMFLWGMKFLRNCTNARANVNGVNILRLGLYSKEKFDEIRKETGVVFDFDNRGILHIFSSEKDFDHTKKQFDFQAKFGCEHRVLTKEETIALEPALEHTSRPIAGGIHAFQDETGDSFLYCNALAKVATERYGVQFRYGISIKEILTENDLITGVSTDQGDLSADSYVMAMGSYSSVFLRQIDINVPIYPMKGYSITIGANDYCPKSSITDSTYKIVYSRLGTNLRIAGTAEFAGYNQAINKKRIKSIVKTAKDLFPKADWEQDIQKWACIRPSTPDGPPIIGPTPYSNLFLNTGHGTLGWTQAAGSAAIVADIIEGKVPAILLHGLTLDRYM